MEWKSFEEKPDWQTAIWFIDTIVGYLYYVNFAILPAAIMCYAIGCYQERNS